MSLDNLEPFFKQADNVRLDATKKDAMQQELLSFMAKNPLPAAGVKKGWFSWLDNAKFKTPAVILAGLALFLLVGGVASVSAASALPGDFLYPLKVGFNEKIEQALAFSDQAKLQVNIQLAELRLQEAEQLSAKGNLTSTDEAQINSNFKAHAAAVSLYIGKINHTQNATTLGEVASDFEASLRAQSIVIGGLSANAAFGKSGQKNPGTDVAAPLVNDIEAAAAQISHVNANIDVQAGGASQAKDADSGKAIQQKISAAQNSVDAVKNLINDSKDKIGSDAVLQSENNLDLAQQKINEGKRQASQNGGDLRAANSSLQQASVIAQESKDLINAKTDLGVNVPITIPAPTVSGDNSHQDNQPNPDPQNGKSSMDTNVNTTTDSGTNTTVTTGTNTTANTTSNTAANTSTATNPNITTNTTIKTQNPLDAITNNLLK